jgi:hypothetical protein
MPAKWCHARQPRERPPDRAGGPLADHQPQERWCKHVIPLAVHECDCVLSCQLLSKGAGGRHTADTAAEDDDVGH